MLMKSLFVKACIPSRLALATAISLTPNEYMKYYLPFAIISALIVSYRYYQYMKLKQQNKTQMSFLDQPVWFNNNRIFHFIIIILFIFCINDKHYDMAKLLMYIDILGGVALTANHYDKFIK